MQPADADATDDVLREEVDPARVRLQSYTVALQHMKVWRQNVPYFYDAMVQDMHPTPW